MNKVISFSGGRTSAYLVHLFKEDPNVRTEGRKHNHKKMYRGRLLMSEVVKQYKDRDRDEMYKALRSSKRYESGSCSESCEAIV